MTWNALIMQMCKEDKSAANVTCAGNASDIK
jgi:hypothetical protein